MNQDERLEKITQLAGSDENAANQSDFDDAVSAAAARDGSGDSSSEPRISAKAKGKARRAVANYDSDESMVDVPKRKVRR